MARIIRLFMCAVVGAASATLGCAQPQDPWPEGKSPRLLTSFPPIYCFVKNVAGDEAAVLTVLKTTGPHDYQPTVKDMMLPRKANLFFINGLGIDDEFAGRLQRNSGNPNLKIVPLAGGFSPQITVGEGTHAFADPHAWLGLDAAAFMVDGIRKQLKEKFPEQAKTYDRNADSYLEELRKFHKAGQDSLAEIKPENRKIIAFHDSLRYFARSFNLQIAGVIESRPGQPPNAAEIDELVTLCKKEHVRVIAVEPQYPAKVAQDLLNDIGKAGITGVRIVEIDPLEMALPEDLAGDAVREFYLKKMKQNIDNLVKVLK